MEKRTLIQEMIAATGALKRANVLIDSILKCPENLASVMGTIGKRVGLTTTEEVMVLVAVFDHHCGDGAADFGDLSHYFKCSLTEIMVFLPAVKSLLAKGYIRSKNRDEVEIRKMSFLLCETVFSAITEGGEIHPSPSEGMEKLNRFSFCEAVHNKVEERSRGKISTKEFFDKVSIMEDEHAGLEMIASLRATIPDFVARVWFYEVCRDFSHEFMDNKTDLRATLRDIYDNVSDGIKVKSAMFDGSHPLFKADLVCFARGEKKELLTLTEKGLEVLYGAISAIFITDYHCKDRYEFLSKVDELDGEMSSHRREPTAVELSDFYKKLEEKNGHLTFICNLTKLVGNNLDRILFYSVCKRMLDGNSLSMGALINIYPKTRVAMVKRELKNGQHVLMKHGLVEITEGGFFENSCLCLSEKGKNLFFEEDVILFEEEPATKGMVDSTKITEKRLFFEPSLEKQLAVLTDSIGEDNFSIIRKRLEEKHLPTGIAALFYGLPGTGKTESALQIARATGRAVMHVDISQTKSHWFGDSEKKIREVFKNYYTISKRSKLKPILLFNEADAVFSKRKDSASSSVAQTENAIQNIILEEMENFDGIMIATTNLTENFDNAFERRFLFKIQFGKPSVESKTQIWLDKLPCLCEEDASHLATAFDFSGGEIDNVVRKVTMEEVLNGTTLTLEHLTALCHEEKISNPQASSGKIGF